MKKLLFSFILAALFGSLSAQSTLCFGTQFDKYYGSYGQHVLCGDFNTDGKLDLATDVYSPGYLWWFHGDGAGGLGSGLNVSVGTNMSSFAMADFNNDTYPDFVGSIMGTNVIRLVTGNGAGNFTAGSSYAVPINPNWVATGDFNGDGYQDVVTSYYNIDSITVHLNDHLGGLNAYNRYASYRQINGMAVADINGDGKLDLVSTSANSANAILQIGNGLGGFGNPLYYSIGGIGGGITLNDFNGDGNKDIAALNTTNNSVEILLGSGGSFGARTSYPLSSGMPTGITSTDYDNDSWADLAVSTTTGKVYILKGNGLGNFTFYDVINTGGGAQAILSGDFDNDTHPDIAISNTGSGAMSVLPNRVRPLFTPSLTTSSICALTSDTLAVQNAANVSYGVMPGSLASFDTFYVAPSATTTYTITATNTLTGCSYIDSITLYVNPLPVVLAPADQSLCNGASTSLVASGATNYSWNPSIGLSNPTVYNPTATPPFTVSYTVTGTDANNCIASDVVTITINALPPVMASADQTICIGNTVNLSASGAMVYSWSPVTGLNSPSISNPDASPSSTTTYTVTGTDASGCTNTDMVTVNVNLNPPVTAVATAPASCPSVSDTLIASGASTYIWSPGGVPGYSIVVNPAVTTTYTVTGTDVFGCVATMTVSVSVGVNSNVTGVIMDSLNNNVASGMVYLFARNPNNPNGSLDSVDAVPISTGSYIFMNVNVGNYIVKAIADTNIAAYATSVPTYYNPSNPNAYQWDSAQVVTNNTCIGSSIGGVDIHVIQIPALTGPGFISGQVVEGAGFGMRWNGPDHVMVPGGPIRGVDVKLGKNPGGSAAARTFTDSTGRYHFSNIPVGDYKIYVDIPNFGMDSVRAISITATDTASINNNYYVDSSMVRVDSVLPVGIKHITEIKEELLVYPNPGTGIFYINSDKTLGEISIYNIMGECVLTRKSDLKSARVDLTGKASGVYFIHTAHSRIRVLKE